MENIAPNLKGEVPFIESEEIISALKKMKNRKTPEADKITFEVIKKDNKLLISNYRAIALVSYQVFFKILLEKMKEKVYRKLEERQYGFRTGRNTVDAIFVVR